ncbi:LysR family transcriptional regulator [Jeotgalibaca porci]|uniref:LysR family transcriptional regulator n=1 Tax=Lactobacillales TaxID=186826 RepID=UPI0035A141A9
MIGNLDLYRIFNVVCQNNSFSQAAKELYMTQSAVSQAMMKLENELDIQLFYRTSKGVILTNEGKLLNEHIRTALGMIQVGEEKLLEFKTLETGRLRIGVGDTISRYYLLPYLEAFHEKYPGVKLTILNGTTSEIIGFIKSGKVDMGVCNLPLKDDQLTVLPCFEVQDTFVGGERYAKLAKTPISLETLVAQSLIFLEDKSNSRVYVEKYVTQKGYALAPDFELGSYDLVLEFAKINLGIACVIREFSQAALESGEVFEVRLKEMIPKREIGICYLKNVSLSQAVRLFVESIQQKNL